MTDSWGRTSHFARTCSMPGCNRLIHGTHNMCKSHFKRSPTSDGVNQGGGRNKLSPDQVAELRRMHAAFRSKREIARHFQIDVKTVNRYLTAPPPEKAS